jgi:hypothetical protein
MRDFRVAVKPMFERYTEGARRVIFFARWEAHQFGAGEIELEHLLLGFLRQTNFFGEEAGKSIRDEIEQGLPRVEKTTTSVDMPVAAAAIRALAYAAEESERADHHHIGVEHLLLGLMRESKTIAALLEKHGIDREKLPREIPPEPEQDLPDRQSLHALIDKLPETAFRRAKRRLEHMQNWPPIPSPGPPEAPGVGGGFARTAALPAYGWRRCSTRTEDGTEVFETQHFHRGHEVTLIERYRMSEDGRKLAYSQEIRGPGKSVHHTIDFDIPES